MKWIKKENKNKNGEVLKEVKTYQFTSAGLSLWPWLELPFIVCIQMSQD